MKLFCYAVIKHPTTKEAEDGKKAEIIIPPSDWALYSSEREVLLEAASKIPEDVRTEHADRLEVAVRPF